MAELVRFFFITYDGACDCVCGGQRAKVRGQLVEVFSLSTMRVLGSKSGFQVSCFTYWVVLPALSDRLFPSSPSRLVLCAQWAPEVRTSEAWLSSPQFLPDVGSNGPYVSGPCEVWATALGRIALILHCHGYVFVFFLQSLPGSWAPDGLVLEQMDNGDWGYMVSGPCAWKAGKSFGHLSLHVHRLILQGWNYEFVQLHLICVDVFGMCIFIWFDVLVEDSVHILQIT